MNCGYFDFINVEWTPMLIMQSVHVDKAKDKALNANSVTNYAQHPDQGRGTRWWIAHVGTAPDVLSTVRVSTVCSDQSAYITTSSVDDTV